MSILSSVGNFFNQTAHQAATVGGTAYDYLTPGLGSNRVTDWGSGTKNTTSTGSKPASSGSSAGASTGGVTDYSKVYQDAYNAALKASQTAIPRFVSPNLPQIYQQATQQATAKVTPIYQQMMATFLAGQQEKLRQQQEATTTGKQALDEQLARDIQDIGTQRTRTTEDTNTAIGDINAQQAYSERTGGLTYDEASRALNEGLGASGMAESGLGQGQVEATKIANNTQSNEQVRQSSNKVEAAKTLMGRTFQDLSTKETRSTEDTGRQKTQLDVNLENFIADQNQALEEEKQTQAVKQAADIQIATNNAAGSLIDQWLASLRGQGYTNQEIANAAAIYKR